MELWVYARTSGDEEGTGQDIKAQAEAVTNRIAGLGHTVAGRSLDDGVSGSTSPDERRGWRDAVEACLEGKAAGIAMMEASRFSRQNPVEALTAWNSIRNQGVHIVCLKENHFTTLNEEAGSSLLLLRFITFWTSWDELEKVKWRTQQAMTEIKEGRRQTKSGKPHGRPRVEIEDDHLEKAKAHYAEHESIAGAHRLLLILRGYDPAKGSEHKKRTYLGQETVARLLGLREPDAKV